MIKKLINNFFFGNFFYGFCAIFLCIETNLQHHLPLNGLHLYTIIFGGIVYYYTFLYLKHISEKTQNERDSWYKKNRSTLKQTQNIILIFLIADIAFFIGKYQYSFAQLKSIEYGQLLLFPIVAIMYTSNVLPFPEIKKLRRIGWLKPFAIGFVWSGLVTVYPVIFYQIQKGSFSNGFSFPSGLLWLENFLFISALCVLFDIKDYEHDKAESLKTFPVQIGITNTIAFVIIPIILFAIIVMLKLNAVANNSNTTFILVNLIPYPFLIFLANSIRKHRSIIYYLFFIDGLMIVKALCGIISVKLLNP